MVEPETSLFNRVLQENITPQDLIAKLDAQILANQVTIPVRIAGYQNSMPILGNPSIFVTVQYNKDYIEPPQRFRDLTQPFSLARLSLKEYVEWSTKKRDHKSFSIDGVNLKSQGTLTEKKALLKLWNMEEEQKPRLFKEFYIHRPILHSKKIGGGADQANTAAKNLFGEPKTETFQEA